MAIRLHSATHKAFRAAKASQAFYDSDSPREIVLGGAPHNKRLFGTI